MDLRSQGLGKKDELEKVNLSRNRPFLCQSVASKTTAHGCRQKSDFKLHRESATMQQLFL